MLTVRQEENAYSVLKVIKYGKFVPEHATMVYKGSSGIAPPILNLGTGWR
jgi:hypothetical protein